MYQNNQLDLLINAYEGSIPPNVAQVIATIQAIYKAYNDDYSRYTENYISMMESTFNSLKTAQLIPEAKGGTLRTTKPIDSENILALLSDYHDKLFGLRYLKFLSEEKKTVVFVGPNGCGKTTLLRNLINATGEDQIGYYPADRLLVINDSYNPERDFATFSKSYQNADKYASDIDNQSQAHYIVQQINQTITLFEKKRATEMDLYAKGKLRLEDSLTEKILGIIFKCLTCIKWWINIDALYPSGEFALQRLQRQQIISVDQHILRIRVGCGVGQCRVFNQQARFYPNRFVLAVPCQFQFIGHISATLPLPQVLQAVSLNYNEYRNLLPVQRDESPLLAALRLQQKSPGALRYSA